MQRLFFVNYIKGLGVFARVHVCTVSAMQEVGFNIGAELQ